MDNNQVNEKVNEKMTKQKVLKVLSITGNVLLWAFLVFSILITTLVLVSQDETDLPSVFGKSFVTVQSDSMSPTFKKGDLIIVEMLTDEEKYNLKKGDVITFYSDLDGDGVNEINSHRIHEDAQYDGGYAYYTTKGDNDVTNPIADKQPVTDVMVLGRWIEGKRIGGVGAAIDFLQTPVGFGVVIVIPLIAFFVYELYNFISVMVTMKAKKSSKQDEEEIKRRAIEEYIREQAMLRMQQEQQTAEQKPAEPATEQKPASEEQKPAESAEGKPEDKPAQ